LEKYKQPDGLRGLLTMFVIAAHWLPEAMGEKISPVLLRWITLIAEAGMYFFFVLSGFLISGILIRNRIKAEEIGYSKRQVWKNYFIRRTLRIFPIYYLCLIFLIFFNVLWIKNLSWWHLSYLSNVFFYQRGDWGLGGHLWSLSTEEQFYIIWPIVMLFAPLRHLKKTVLIIVLIAPLFRMAMNIWNPSYFTQFLTPSLFDGLGLGALLALHLSLPSSRKPVSEVMLSKFAGAIGILVFVMFELRPFSWPIWNEFHPFFEIFRRSSLALIGIFLVQGSITGFRGIAKWTLEHPIVLFLGKISYALYLFHNFQLYLFDWFKIDLPVTGAFILLHLAILIAAATLSWYLVELPFNSLKKYFPYIKLTQVTPDTQPLTAPLTKKSISS